MPEAVLSRVLVFGLLASFVAATKSNAAFQHYFIAGRSAYRLSVASQAMGLEHWNDKLNRFEPVALNSPHNVEEYLVDAAIPSAGKLDLLVVQNLGVYSIWRLEIPSYDAAASLTRRWSGQMEPPRRIVPIPGDAWLVIGEGITLIRPDGHSCTIAGALDYGTTAAQSDGAVLSYRHGEWIGLQIDVQRCRASQAWRRDYPFMATVDATADDAGWLIMATNARFDSQIVRVTRDGDAFSRYSLPRTDTRWYFLSGMGCVFAATHSADQPLFAIDGRNVYRVLAPHGAVPVHGATIKDPLVVVGNAIERASVGDLVAPQRLRRLSIGRFRILLDRDQWLLSGALLVLVVLALYYGLYRRYATKRD